MTAAPSMTQATTFAGYLNYTPSWKLPRHHQMELRDLLIERGINEDGENPSINIDWRFNNTDGPRFHTRESVLLYVDGADWETPGCVFLRRHSDNTMSVHIPNTEPRHAALTEASIWLWRPNRSTITRNLHVLNGYVSQIINTPEAWEPFTFDDRYEGLA